MGNLSADLNTIFGSNTNISRVTVVKRDRNGEEVTYTKEFAAENNGVPSSKGNDKVTDETAAVKNEEKKDNTKDIYSSIPEVSVYDDKDVGLKMNPVLVKAFNADLELGRADALNTIKTIELAGEMLANEKAAKAENADVPALGETKPEDVKPEDKKV